MLEASARPDLSRRISSAFRTFVCMCVCVCVCVLYYKLDLLHPLLEMYTHKTHTHTHTLTHTQHTHTHTHTHTHYFVIEGLGVSDADAVKNDSAWDAAGGLINSTKSHA